MRRHPRLYFAAFATALMLVSVASLDAAQRGGGRAPAYENADTVLR